MCSSIVLCVCCAAFELFSPFCVCPFVELHYLTLNAIKCCFRVVIQKDSVILIILQAFKSKNSHVPYAKREILLNMNNSDDDDDDDDDDRQINQTNTSIKWVMQR